VIGHADAITQEADTMSLDLQRRKPSPRPHKQTRPVAPCTDTTAGRVVNIVIDGEVVEAIETGDPCATRAIRLARASVCTGMLDFPLLVLLHHAGDPMPALTIALYAVTVVFLALAVGAWAVDYNCHHTGGTR
jgi:hypothetical protein